jgi:hypothetical protein
MQAMRTDHHAAYDRTKTRGMPRSGKARLHGLVYCGACGHTRVVQDTGGPRSLCHSLRQQYRPPGCQYIAAAPVDTRGGDAFFQALSPVALDGSAQALAQRQQQAERIAQAQGQQLERRRYAAASCERPCHHVAPAHRHVAAELEHAWEVALQALTQAEAAQSQRAQAGTPPANARAPTLQAACRAIGQQRPALGSTDIVAQAPRKAWLRWLIATVVIQRARRDQVHTRILWRGGETTTFEVPGALGALTDLPTAYDMAPQMRGLFAAGTSDDAIARPLTPHGERAPRRPTVLPSPGTGIRLKLGRMPKRSQSHPRRSAGSLTVPQ